MVIPKSSCRYSLTCIWPAHHEPSSLNSFAFSGSWEGLLLDADEEETGIISFPKPCNSEDTAQGKKQFVILWASQNIYRWGNIGMFPHVLMILTFKSLEIGSS